MSELEMIDAAAAAAKKEARRLLLLDEMTELFELSGSGMALVSELRELTTPEAAKCLMPPTVKAALDECHRMTEATIKALAADPVKLAEAFECWTSALNALQVGLAELEARS